MSIREFSERQEAYDLAKEVGPDGIRTLLNIMCEAYFDLYKSDKINPNMNETEITEEWYVFILLRWKNIPEFPLVPLSEKSDKTKAKKRGKPPTIDFCFRDKWDNTLYFGAECKILEEGNTTSIKEYVLEGMDRYICGKYSQNYPTGAIIGYIFNGAITNIVEKINEKLMDSHDGALIKKAGPLGSFKEHHESEHERTDGISPFLIHHLFFSFT